MRVREPVCHLRWLCAALFLMVPSGAYSECKDGPAKLVSMQGSVEWQRWGESTWNPAQLELRFCPGEKVRTLRHSRATLQLTNETYIPMDQLTTVSFPPLPEPQEESLLDLLVGKILVRSRTAKPMKVRTPFINALIRGTEFLVQADRSEGQVTVFEGRVEAGNPKGKLALESGQTAVAGRGEPPRTKLLVKPEQSVQWALYYPPIIDLARLRRSHDTAIRNAVSRYLKGDIPGGLRELESIPGGSGAIDQAVLQAALLLAVGRVDEAEPIITGHLAARPGDGEALALQAIIDLARNDPAKASRRADQALKASPVSPVAWTAQSYVQQARFDLEAASKSAERAAELDPENALARTRLAELYVSLGRRRDGEQAANEAIRLAPGSARARSVLGFTQLTAMAAAAAERSFREAIRLDSHDPMAHFGLGLARIRLGELEAGTADLEIAASLDPNDSLSRSYLGKAYYEQKRAKPAETQFSLAKQFDPSDPTPWFYDGIKKQTENRPVEALRDVQKAIELNDGRAVYRSRQLLDDDLATRSSALARIYNDLGFSSRALVEGWKSVAADPANFSAHRLLADSYATLPGQEVARASELLQSQLLQPINSTPIQPHLGEARLLVPQFSGPAQTSFNEFNPLFSRNGFHLQTTGLVGNLDTYGDEAVHSGIWNKFSYSIGQFHYQTNGFRPNNDLKQDIYNAFAQAAVTPDLSVQAEYRHRELEHGDLFFNGDLDSTAVDPLFRRNLRTDLVRSGLHYSPTGNSDILLSLMYSDAETVYTKCRLCPYAAPTPNTFSTSERGFLGEAQYRYHGDRFDAILGAGQQSLSATLSDDYTFAPPLHYHMDVANAYAYSNIRYPDRLTWILGLGVNAYTNHHIGGRDQVNPKFGLLWEPTPDTLVRLGAFRTFVRGTEVAATVEPTQIAGFTQFIDGYPGTDAWHYGIGLDQRFSPDLMVGAEASIRDLKKPTPQGTDVVDSVKINLLKEQLARAYADWVIYDSFVGHLEYRYEDFQSGGTTVYRNHIIPVGVDYFHPTGLSAAATFSYVDQERFQNSIVPGRSIDPAQTPHSAGFGLIDLALRYRLPKRFGVATLMVKNLLDHRFAFVGQNFGGVRTPRAEESPPFVPDRTVSFQLTLAF